MEILIVKTSSMGDLIHTWPALTDLVTYCPTARLTWLCEKNFSDIAQLHPTIKQVIPIQWRYWRKHLFCRQTWKDLRETGQQLRQQTWEKVVDCQGLLKSAIPAKYTKSSVAGYDWHSAREPIASLLYNKRFSVGWNQSAINRNRLLFSQIFNYIPAQQPVFGVPSPARPDWINTPHYAVLLHATSRASKEWPETHWIKLGKRLWETYRLPSVLPWGNPQEQARALYLSTHISHAIMAPAMQLTEAAGLLGQAKAVIGVDTGLTHLANALNVPLVAIYTDTNPAATGVLETPVAKNIGNQGLTPSVEAVFTQLEALLRL